MALFNSGNPTLSQKIFERSLQSDTAEVMTERGTMNKFGFLFLLVMAGAFFTWNAFYQGKNVYPWILAAAIGGLVIAIVLAFAPKNARYLAPAYGLVEGVFLGGISAVYNYAFQKSAPGIVMGAIGLTFGIVIAMFLLYNFGVIKATERLRSVIFTAISGIMLFYVLSFVLGLFGIQMPLLYDSSPLGIGLSVFIVGIAAFKLILDFDMIEKGSSMGAPKYMEWYCAFGLLVTIVWLYVEVLQLLAKINKK